MDLKEIGTEGYTGFMCLRTGSKDGLL